MFKPIQHKTATLPLPDLISRSPLRRGFLIPLALALAFSAFSPMAQGADGGLNGENTAEGTGALNRIATGASGATGGYVRQRQHRYRCTSAREQQRR